MKGSEDESSRYCVNMVKQAAAFTLELVKTIS